MRSLSGMMRLAQAFGVRGLRWCHGELVHWRKEKRRVRKLALLNAKQRRIAR